MKDKIILEEKLNVPLLRFPEFSEEWKEKKIGEVAKINTGKKDTQNKVENGKYPFFVRSQIIEKINSYSYDGEAILTAGDGVGVGKVFHYINGKFDYHQRVYKQAAGKFGYIQKTKRCCNKQRRDTCPTNCTGRLC